MQESFDVHDKTNTVVLLQIKASTCRTPKSSLVASFPFYPHVPSCFSNFSSSGTFFSFFFCCHVLDPSQIPNTQIRTCEEAAGSVTVTSF